MQKMKKILLFAVLACLCILCIPLGVSAAETQSDGRRVVKVGYIDYGGFIEKNSNGEFRGYAVSYLEEIAKHTGWVYEYEFDSWENCLDKLENGEIDLLCSAQYTEERSARFDYSDLPIGSESGILYALMDKEDLYYEDFEKMDGMYIGVLRDSYQTETLPQYAQEHGFSYQEVVFDSETEMENALQSQSVDMIAAGSLALHKDLKTVARYGTTPFYLITGKGRSEIMGPINEALIDINNSDPYFQSKLNEEFYSESATTNVPLFTREEAEFIRNSKPIEIGFMTNGYPYSYYNSNTKKCEGIVEDLMDQIVLMSRLKLKYIPIEEDSIPINLLKDGSYDIIAGLNRSENYLEDSQLHVTNALLQSNAVVVHKKGVAYSNLNDLTVVVPTEYPFLADYVMECYSGCDVIYKDTTEECLDAVISGEADITVQNSYVMSYLLQKPVYLQLTVLASESVSMSSCIVTNSNVNPLLISVLNKTIDCLDSNTVQQITMNYTVANPYESTFADILYQYRYALVLLAVIVVLVIIGVVVIVRYRMAKAIHAKETQVLRRRAEYDSMTGIYNSETFFEKVREAIKQDTKGKYDILCMDIDRFKFVNDLFGTEEGDKLLGFVAKNLEYHVSNRGGICGRLGGNSFVAYVPHDDVMLKEIYQFSKTEMNKYPLEMDLTLRFGVYCVDDKTLSVRAMTDRARLAMEQIKGSAFHHVGIYSAEQRMRLLKEQDIINDMHNAIKEEQFQVFIQPKYQLEQGRMIGGEALVRWKHPVKGMISPGEFIPIFEKNGFITKIDEYVWDKTCQLICEWKKQGIEVVPISVNISRVNFYTTDLKEHFLKLIHTYGVTTEELELEVTESALAEDDETLYKQMHELQEAGFKILMDDFGSGYSSLNMLKEAPIDIIKMDLRFIQGQDPMGRSVDILRGIMSMSEAMQIPVIAEGVETEENVAMLKSIHCNMAQGYYFSRPLPCEEFEAMLNE